MLEKEVAQLQAGILVSYYTIMHRLDVWQWLQLVHYDCLY
jgi:hypothetical protein